MRDHEIRESGSLCFLWLCLLFGIFFRSGAFVWLAGVGTGRTFLGLRAGFFLIIGLVKTGTFENKSRSQAKQSFGFAFFALRTAFDRRVIH